MMVVDYAFKMKAWYESAIGCVQQVLLIKT